MLAKQKAEVRKAVRKQARELCEEEKASWDSALCEQVLSLPEIAGADCVYAYVSLRTEAGTRKLLQALWRMGKSLALPRVEGEKMRFYLVPDFSRLLKGAYGILEPDETCRPAEDEQAVMLVPGTAFTRDGLRLGKGGGYYDRYLNGEPGHRTIGLAYDFQVLETLPAGDLDRKMDLVVTPTKIYRLSGKETKTC